MSEEIEQIKNSLKANEYILSKHPNMKESIEKENAELKERLAKAEEKEKAAEPTEKKTKKRKTKDEQL